MTILKLKNEIAELKGSLKTSKRDYAAIIYNGKRENSDGSLNYNSFIKINNIDVSEMTVEQKKKVLSNYHVFLYLPKKNRSC